MTVYMHFFDHLRWMVQKCISSTTVLFSVLSDDNHKNLLLMCGYEIIYLFVFLLPMSFMLSNSTFANLAYVIDRHIQYVC